MKPRSHIPLATYRLQLNRDFRFTQATEVVPYLAALGVSHCYISPCLKARPGSIEKCQNVFTGKVQELTKTDGHTKIGVSAALAEFPVALCVLSCL